MKKEMEGPCKFFPKPGLDGNILTNRQQLSENTYNDATFDRKAALEESRKILALLNSPELHPQREVNLQHGQIAISSCHFCKCVMCSNVNSKCKYCHEDFCARHRAEINHKCEKISEQTASYLNAKNQFKYRLKAAKDKIKC
jgi:hypothetical protein